MAKLSIGGILGAMGGMGGRPKALAGRGGAKLSPSLAAGISEADDDDEDGEALLDALADSLGVDGRRLRASLMSGVEAQSSLSEDGAVIQWALSTALTTEVKAVTLVSATPVIVVCKTGYSGWHVEEIAFDPDGGGVNDTQSVILDVAGHQPIGERFIIKGGKGLDLAWGRLLLQSHTFTLTAPGATANEPVTVILTANGALPKSESVAAHARLVREAKGQRGRSGLSKLGARNALGASKRGVGKTSFRRFN